MSAETFLVVGWPSCKFYQKAVNELKSRGKKVVTLDERQYGQAVCGELPTWNGNGGPGWRSPHVFRYIGGSNDLEQYLRGESSLVSGPATIQGCREILGKIICS